MKTEEPIYRFDKFDKNWLFVKISDIAGQFKTGGTPSTKEQIFWDGTIPWIQSSDLQKDILFGIKPQKFISEKGLQNSSAKIIPKNSIAIVTRVGVGKLAIIDQDYATSQDFLSLSDFGGDIQFIVYSTYRMLQKESTQLQGTSIKGITKEDLLSKIISLPEIEEQSAIGSLFRTFDNLLASYKDNLANYQSLKATMLSKMFPKAGQTVPDIRLDGFEGEWENIRLGDCAIIKGRLGWKSLKQEEYTEVGPSMIAGKHIKNGVIDWGKVDHIPQWRYEESPDIMLENGDIIFSKDGSLGNPALVSNLKGEATINSTMMLVRLDKKVSSQFFYQVLTSSVFQKLIYLKVSGSSIPHLFQADMQDFKFFAPCIEEQQAIGVYFSNLDSLIAAHQEKISQFETLKRKLLQDMFI